MTIICGDCLDVMKTFPDNHFSGIVTDPPYGISFMSKDWDHGIPGVPFWQEALRICKPGSFILAFGGTRTYHRLTCAIEDAGWEIRDCIMWVYGSGFPKSHNHFGLEGYGTALKPAYEPIIMAMKPCDGTFKQNAEKWGQAGINIDGCRIKTTDKLSGSGSPPLKFGIENARPFHQDAVSRGCNQHEKGRWPANIIFDEEASIGLGDKARYFYCAKASSRERNEGTDGLETKTRQQDGKQENWDLSDGKMRARLVTKPQANHHPTVKPLALMRYLLTLIAPPQNALILDPFAGSGTTILAAKQLGIEAIGIEKQPEYAEIAQKRIESFQPSEQELDLFSCV